MTLMRVFERDGMVLTYDTDDVADTVFSTPSDVVDVTQPGDTARRLELGQAHLDLHIDFLPGKRALWVKEETDRKA